MENQSAKACLRMGHIAATHSQVMSNTQMTVCYTKGSENDIYVL